MYKPRWLEKFVRMDGSEEYIFPRTEHEWESKQRMFTPSTRAIGAHYGVDMLNHVLPPKDIGEERIRFTLFGEPDEVNTALDELRAKMYEFGRGMLYTTDADGNRRWAYARASDMPDISIGVRDRVTIPVSIGFRRYSDWRAPLPKSITVPLNVTNQNVIVPNVGNAQVFDVQLRFIAFAVGGWNNPIVTNEIASSQITINRSAASATDQERILAGEYRVEYSTDSGGTWTPDYASLEIPGDQVTIFRLMPGDNVVQVQTSGTPNGELIIEFYPAFH